MRLTVLGCSGSFPGPDSPASSYLVQADDAAGRTWNLLMDLGPGSFGALQRHVDPRTVDLACLSHLHPDHCADTSAMHVFCRFHPEGEGPKVALVGPAATSELLWEAYACTGAQIMTPHFEISTWRERQPVRMGPLTVTPFPVSHPIESYALRIEGPSDLHPGRAVLAYSGDTDECPGVAEAAADVDLFLCEAAYVEGRDTARGVHMTGRQAGAVAARARAGRLVLTHLVPWNDPQVTVAEARTTYDGPLEVAVAGLTTAI